MCDYHVCPTGAVRGVWSNCQDSPRSRGSQWPSCSYPSSRKNVSVIVLESCLFLFAP